MHRPDYNGVKPGNHATAMKNSGKIRYFVSSLTTSLP
jgi:hypothetical protein